MHSEMCRRHCPSVTVFEISVDWMRGRRPPTRRQNLAGLHGPWHLDSWLRRHPATVESHPGVVKDDFL